MSMRHLRPVAAAAVLMIVPGLAKAGEDLACGKGFTKTSETATRITCLRSTSVKSELAADKIIRNWADRFVCAGKLVDPQSSAGLTSEGLWAVTIRYICAGSGE